MLRANASSLLRSQVAISRALLHTSTPILAAKPVKAIAQGFKKDEGKKVKKNSGSFKFYEDYVSTGRFHTKAVELNVSPLTSDTASNVVANYTDVQYKRLVQSGSFKKDQFNELFSKPITLVRDETVRMAKFIEESSVTPSKDNRVCFIGEKGIGKSTLLAQTHALIPQESIILPISYATKLVDGTTNFWLDPALGTFTQPTYLKKFLSKIRYANESSLEKIKLTQDYSIENPVRARPPTRFSASNNLLQVLKTRFSARQRGAVFELLINELTKQDQFAVYVTVDNFGALTSNPFTAYRNTENKPVAVEQLQICQKLFEVTSGQRSFAKGGVILSTSSDDTPSVTLNAGLGLVKPDAYTKSQKYSRELSSRLVGVKPLEVGKFSKDNVGSLVETLIEANVFRKDELEKNTKESLIDQKFVLSGNGNPLELLKSVTMFY